MGKCPHTNSPRGLSGLPAVGYWSGTRLMAKPPPLAARSLRVVLAVTVFSVMVYALGFLSHEASLASA